MWRIAFAKTSIRRVITTCDYIMTNVQNPEAPIYHPLVTAIFVLYAGPFGENNGAGKISSKYSNFDSLEKRNLHHLIIHGRNKFYAHVDAGTKLYDVGGKKAIGHLFQLNIVLSDIEGETAAFATNIVEPRLTLETIPRIKSLSEELMKALCNDEVLLLEKLVDCGYDFKPGKNTITLE